MIIFHANSNKSPYVPAPAVAHGYKGRVRILQTPTHQFFFSKKAGTPLVRIKRKEEA